MRSLLLLLLSAVVVSAFPKSSNRIIGGTETVIDRYPETAGLLFQTFTGAWSVFCGGSIINNRSILSAAHCTYSYQSVRPENIRIRLGSSLASSGGVVHNVALIINHPDYNERTIENDICVVRLENAIDFTNVIKQGFFAGLNFPVPDNSPVWAVGWGMIDQNTGERAVQLRHVQIYVVNHDLCRERYTATHSSVVVGNDTLCAGVMGEGGRGPCSQDSGGPLFHEGVIVGVVSWGSARGCAHPDYPTVFARVSYFIDWIQANL